MNRSMFYIIIISFIFYFVSCDTDNKESVSNFTPEIESFIFLSEKNPQLKEDVICTISGDCIYAMVPYLENTDSLIASFSGTYDEVILDGINQISGETKNNYNKITKYIVRSIKGKERVYNIYIYGGTGLPRIDIKTEDSQNIKSKTEYVNAFPANVNFRITA